MTRVIVWGMRADPHHRGHPVLLLPFALVAAWPSSAEAIIDGTLAETCAFPPVVRLHGQRSAIACETEEYAASWEFSTQTECYDYQSTWPIFDFFVLR